MIKFFRKIRYNLMSENQMGKYFKYAIGEILLVVIGILIALQINNWNENLKEDQKIQSILLKIREDLTADLDVINANLMTLKRKDSLANLIFNKEIDLETFERIGGSFLSFTSVVLDINTSGYDQLRANIDKIPSSYSPVVSSLKEIYINSKSNMDLYNRQMDQTIDGHTKILAESHSWYADWSRGISSQKANIYFMNDSLGLNQMGLYLSCLEATAFEGLRLKRLSIKAIKLIDSVTNNKVDLPVNATINLNKNHTRKGLVGTYILKENKDRSYRFTDTILHITEEENVLYLNSTTYPKTPLYWNHNLTFIAQPGFISFIKTEKYDLKIQRRSGNLIFEKEKI